jgi:hypothetical protein
MTAQAKKTAKPEFDLSNFAIDDDVSLWDAAPDVPLPPAEPTPTAPAPQVPPMAQPMPPPAMPPAPTPSAPTAPAMLARAPEPVTAPAWPPFLLPGRSTRVAATFWISPELRRAIRQAMIGSLEGVYRSQGDLVEAAVRRFLNLG